MVATTMHMRFIRILSTDMDRLGPLGPDISQAVFPTRTTADDQQHGQNDKDKRHDDEQPQKQREHAPGNVGAATLERFREVGPSVQRDVGDGGHFQSGSPQLV